LTAVPLDEEEETSVYVFIVNDLIIKMPDLNKQKFDPNNPSFEEEISKEFKLLYITEYTETLEIQELYRSNVRR
jgi:hypothetical protein